MKVGIAMIFRNINYFTKEAVLSLLKNRLMTVASIITVSSTTLIVILSYILGSNVNFLLDNFGNSIGMTVYINEDVTSQENNDFYNTLLQIEHIASTNYISKEEALNIFSETIGDDSGVLKGLAEDNPLPRSYEITLEDSVYANKVIEELNKYVGDGNVLSSIRHAQTETEILLSLNNGIRVVGIALITGLSFIAIIIIMNTIRLAVNSRRIEINIMKYVGATNAFIRWPFILEGVFIGILGASIPLFICIFSYNRVIDAIYENMPILQEGVNFLSASQIFNFLIPFCLLLGASIGIFGSASSIRKHLNV